MRNHQNGFTLLEVMIALAVLAIALPVLLGLRNRDLALIQEARALTAATLLAEETLFQARMGDVPPVGEQTGDYATIPPGFPIFGDVVDRAPGFRWTRTVSATSYPDMKEIRIRVSWPAAAAGQAVELQTYVLPEKPKSSPQASAR